MINGDQLKEEEINKLNSITCVQKFDINVEIEPKSPRMNTSPNKSPQSSKPHKIIKIKRSKKKLPHMIQNPYVMGEPYPNSDPERFLRLLKKESTQVVDKSIQPKKSKIKINIQRQINSDLTKSSNNLPQEEIQDVLASEEYLTSKVLD